MSIWPTRLLSCFWFVEREVISLPQVMQAIFLLDYGKGSALSSLIYNPRVAVDNQLGATVNCQLAMGNYNANSSPVITASYLAFSFKHSFIREKEYRIRALSGEMNKIPALLSYPLGFPFFPLSGSKK